MRDACRDAARDATHELELHDEVHAHRHNAQHAAVAHVPRRYDPYLTLFVYISSPTHKATPPPPSCSCTFPLSATFLFSSYTEEPCILQKRSNTNTIRSSFDSHDHYISGTFSSLTSLHFSPHISDVSSFNTFQSNHLTLSHLFQYILIYGITQDVTPLPLQYVLNLIVVCKSSTKSPLRLPLPYCNRVISGTFSHLPLLSSFPLIRTSHSIRQLNTPRQYQWHSPRSCINTSHITQLPKILHHSLFVIPSPFMYFPCPLPPRNTPPTSSQCSPRDVLLDYLGLSLQSIDQPSSPILLWNMISTSQSILLLSRSPT